MTVSLAKFVSVGSDNNVLLPKDSPENDFVYATLQPSEV